MKEFMLLIHDNIDYKAIVSPEQQQQQMKKIMDYMGNLMKEGKLKSAQPLAMEGTMISGTNGAFKDGPFNETKEVIAGYFLIQANDLNEAIEIAKANPILQNGTGARIEVRPIKIIDGINE